MQTKGTHLVARQHATTCARVTKMPTTDPYESEILAAFEKGSLKSVATKAELTKFKAAARATAIKDRRVNIRLSTGDLRDIQVKALEEGMPYQTLIASILHKYVTGRLAERETMPGEPKAADKPSKTCLT